MAPRILFVEDEHSTHFGVREYFAERGHQVDCACSREEALEHLAARSYRVVIADLQLSGRGAGDRAPEGLELIEHIRQEHPETRVLVLTACDAELELEARRRGADRFLQKPQPLSVVAEMVELLCGGDAMREEAAVVAEGRTRKKVLLVDDSSTVLLMERALLSRSYEVISARDGQEGVEKALAEEPDLILMDVVMPRMNGIDAVRRLRSNSQTRDIPIIMVSTRGELESVESGYESGCNDYVTKPFSGVELLAKVKSCLGG